MKALASRIGIDIGALFIKAVRIDAKGNLKDSFYQKHNGDPGKALEAALSRLGVGPNEPLGITGSGALLFAETLGVAVQDITRCQILAVRQLIPTAVNIIDVGGNSSTLIQLNAKGDFQGYATNSLCAAGTGSFLDEQAIRLQVSYEEMEGFDRVTDPPTIATRCSVFAKSDLIHRQQEGYSKAAMWSGLCRGMTQTLANTLLNGKPLAGVSVFIGGVGLNREVVRWLGAAFPERIELPRHPHLVTAMGAALLATQPQESALRQVPIQAVLGSLSDRTNWPLSLEKSVYPSFETLETYTDEAGNEVRITAWPGENPARVFLGLDIGSTSTKLMLMNDREEALIDIYRKTGGDPIEATQQLFRAVRALEKSRGIEFEVLGVGTTGSGRKMIGKIVGADAIINEISAHVAGAAHTDPTIDTIFEIGGQDSKYMHVKDGHIRNSNMNYVCAAGTGSFVEEQAKKLGYPVSAVGQAVLHIHPPRTADRCTVFMEQDVTQLVRTGSTPEDALAGVMVSVVKNYLNKVVGNRYRSTKKILFQGATARNQALVAAFERVLGVQMVVSPYCHVMGAYGVALLTRQRMKESGLDRSAFRGLSLDEHPVEIRKEECSLCQNRCAISLARIEGVPEEPSWGYLCGRDPTEQRVRVNPAGRLLRLRQKLWQEIGKTSGVDTYAPVIGIPQALTTYTYLPLWQAFFNTLGFKVELSGRTTDAIRRMGTSLCGAEFCFPAKVAIGHAAHLAHQSGVDFIFLPWVISERDNRYTTAAKFCPYVESAPAFTRTALQLNGMAYTPLLSPVIDFRLPEKQAIFELWKALHEPLKVTRDRIRQAWLKGLEAQQTFEAHCHKLGQETLEQAARKGEKLLIIVGRPYNIYDTGVNLGLPQKLAEQGRTVVPLDLLRPDLSTLSAAHHNTFWSYGQKILAALQRVAGSDLLDGVYLTNFNCGPDSFLLSFSEEILGSRPLLTLELDEHGADAGYMTRIEAFSAVLKRNRSGFPVRKVALPRQPDLRGKTIWVPPMHPYASPLAAAAFRRHGFRSQPIPLEDSEAFELGKSQTRGSECLPTSLTIGAFLKVLKDQADPGEHVLFMPTAEGPCRFGQYATLHRQILDRIGYPNVDILSPTSFNSYQGMGEAVRRDFWKALLAGDILFKAGCKIRPYEVEPGSTQQALLACLRALEQSLESGHDLAKTVGECCARLSLLPRKNLVKPLVGVVGEIYIRCNSFANENVILAIERYGGEAWLCPMSEWILYTATVQRMFDREAGRLNLRRALSSFKNLYLFHQEQKFYRAASPLLDDRLEPPVEEVIEEGIKHLPIRFEGEALLTVGRAKTFAKQGAVLVVNCAPFGCMPGTLTTALFRELSGQMGIPVVNMFYDGHGQQNERLQVFLNNSMQKKSPARKAPQERPLAASRERSDKY